ncbi:MAG: SUMF1/EgtB/PvdO family nonheme iron enzyme [Gemmataceae bacterium]|nr:SUMF1/EgtB/PvdO family nonheme iron enzyme [Gemmataceae bacterium]
MVRLDPLGFPVVRLPAAGLEVGLLPVTRAQLDYLLGDTTDFHPDDLAALDRANPRASWRRVPADRPEGVFAAGVTAAEADRFAGWLGGGFRLPTAAEWRAADAAVAALGAFPHEWDAASAVLANPAARSILDWSIARGPATWLRVGLWDDGLLEWVRTPDGGFGLLGRPRTGLIRLVHNPRVHDPVRPTSADRHPAFGFRLVRSLTAGSA